MEEITSLHSSSSYSSQPFFTPRSHDHDQHLAFHADSTPPIGNGQPSRPSLDSLLMPEAKLHSCDVYIGFQGQEPSLLRFVNWLRAKLELHGGVSCFVADQSRCHDPEEHGMIETAMEEATLGVVVITKRTFSSHSGMGEISCFLGRRNLVPIFFGLSSEDCLVTDVIAKKGALWERDGGELWLEYGGSEREWKEAVDGLAHVGGVFSKLEVNAGNWRDCVADTVVQLAMRLGKANVTESIKSWIDKAKKEKLPFPRNSNFIGRKAELLELELMLFGSIGGKVDNQFESEKEATWKDSKEEISMEGEKSPTMPYLLTGRNNGSSNVLYGKGIACVSGDSGIGKTELLLEFAYRFAQRYHLVLWISGETRYICQSYLNLLPLLGIDLIVENELCLDRESSFKELEEEAIHRVRKELMRDLPFLVVIDNLEDEKDWWSGRSVMDLLPHFGGETHVIISTRLPHVLNMQPLRLSHLSGAEALSLMKGVWENLPTAEIDALKFIEQQSGRITIGLALVGGIFAQTYITPTRLLDIINKMPAREINWSDKDDLVLSCNPFLVKLLDVCFWMFDRDHGPRSLETRMVLASGWFSPLPIRASLLALAASQIADNTETLSIWRKPFQCITCRCFKPNHKKSEAQAEASLVNFRVAQSSTTRGHIHFHGIFRLYARKIGGVEAARAMVRAAGIHGSVTLDSMHIWAASFLVFHFGKNPSIIELKTPELVSFITQLALPLAVLTHTSFCRFEAAAELLQQCTMAIEKAEEQVERDLEKSSCWSSLSQTNTRTKMNFYEEVALLKARVLETRVELMLKGGKLDLAETLCRKIISIRQVICGWEHPSTKSAEVTIDMIVKTQAHF